MRLSLPLALLAALCACGGGEEPSDAQTEAAGPAPAADGGHGAALDLGTVELGDYRFGMTKFGDLAPGTEGAIEVRLLRAPPGTDMASLNTYLWVEDGPGAQVSAPTKGAIENGVFHFHVTPRSEAVRAMLRVRVGAADLRGSLPLDGHGHEHASAPHHGVGAPFKGADGAVAGYVELKLHDDKGDLELWLTVDEAGHTPYDLPIDAGIQIVFSDVQGRDVTLRPRNTERNEDENGKPNVREGRTNYFIFPTSAGEDASWLQGKEFNSIVIVRFEREGNRMTSEEFVLTPHTHD